VGRHVRLRELLVGIEGLALLRDLYDGTDGDAGRRLEEVRRLLDDETFASVEQVAESDPRAGYQVWSQTYDEPGNPIIGLEEPAVRSLVDHLPVGRALDAACGTGRHARYLVDLGHKVVGVDITPAMLTVARGAVPEADFYEADLRAIPEEDSQFALVVCGLALAHVAELDKAAGELARVLAPGGHLIVSVLHPLQAFLGWHAPFEDDAGNRRFVREHPHTHADYLAAFQTAGLAVGHCVEPVLSPAEVAAKRRAFRHIPEAALAAYGGLPAVLVWEFERP
jgi:SAM-dependent methyltransferase